ncbi:MULTISPECIES: universal stress protein [Cyanophyceae]|uniref:universal stress protein n=1 Tax=Cyanophyceae TaxID=3028117 RepID=UPI001685D2CF|nr:MULTISPECIES: universal stress protein [Cyanophyceae]MBD1916562.1 universal stress protein [Phormidium sp. FACHB-77]MBD2032129.1 universal stress protein [Phormidium sp. FACHB-322]MBD2053009.1 universal stress protein [Leptolyngbya sp. FACHB-60]
MKRILLCTDGSTFAQSSYPYAAWFAQGIGANVDVLYVTDSRGQATAEASNLSGSIGLGAAESLLKQLVEVEHERAKLNHQKAKLILADAEAAIAAHGATTVKLIHKTGFLVDCLEDLEADVDLVVMGKRGEAADFASGHLGANVDRIVRSGHKPCLITPKTVVPMERLLVAYDGSPTGQKLLRFLLDTPGLRELEIHLLTVAGSESDAEKTRCLAEARTILQASGLKPEASLQVGETEKAIARYIDDHDISLLILGAYGHRRIRHLVIGSTTVQLLRSSQIPVLLYR